MQSEFRKLKTKTFLLKFSQILATPLIFTVFSCSFATITTGNVLTMESPETLVLQRFVYYNILAPSSAYTAKWTKLTVQCFIGLLGFHNTDWTFTQT